MHDFSLRGALTALVTPFTADGSEIAWADFERLVEEQLKAGIDGLVPCGTTGESPTLGDAEKVSLIAKSAELARGKSLVLGGIGSSDTKKAAQQAKAATSAGAGAVMLVMPAYSRPSQQGLLLHIETVARATPLPVVLYNIPGRTAVNLELDTLEQVLERCENVIGLKDASGNVAYCQAALARVGERLTVLSGDDSLTLPMISVGARGVISVTSNVLPAAVRAAAHAALEGRLVEAREQHLRLLSVHEAMFCTANPGPVKAALARRGLIKGVLRPPLVMPSEAHLSRITAALRAFES